MTNFRDDAQPSANRWMKPLGGDSLQPTRGSSTQARDARYTPNELMPGETQAPSRPLVADFPRAQATAAPSDLSQATPPPAIPSFGARNQAPATADDASEYAEVDAALSQAVAQTRRVPSRLVERDEPSVQIEPPRNEIASHLSDVPAVEPSADAVVDSPSQVPSHLLPDEQPDDDPDDYGQDAVPTEQMAVPAPVPLEPVATNRAPRRWGWVILVAVVLLAAAALALWQTGVLDTLLGRELPSPSQVLRELFRRNQGGDAFAYPTMPPDTKPLAPTIVDALG